MADEQKPTGTPTTGGDAQTPEPPAVSSPVEGGMDPGYSYYDDPYTYPGETTATAEVVPVTATPVASTGGSSTVPPSSSDSGAEDDGDDEGMLRMSFVEHLEELRSRIIKCLYGLIGAFGFSLLFANNLWQIISAPAMRALKNLNAEPYLIATTPMEQFSTIWVKVPLVVAIFLASPIIVYQVWSFIAPGLYKRERRWAVPFILCTSGLFIAGGLFAYFVIFRFGLEFLLGIGRDVNVKALITISEYFELFVNVTLGVGVVFELPVLIFFLTLIRVASPSFLLRHSRYAILAIVIVAAVITPTPDLFNLMMIAIPMTLLYFVGLFASYLLVLNREGRQFPWKIVWLVLLGILVVAGAVVAVGVAKFGWRLTSTWPFVVP
jgi:sec-independent protein translocase protein TatC